jgi:beta-glucosidase
VVLGNFFGATTGWPLCRGSGVDGCESESHDRTAIELPGKQVALVQALRGSSSKPLVCVLVHGGAVAIGDAANACDAVVDLWVPGQMGGTALADIIFGEYSPAGRSPITFYSATADLPPMDKKQIDEYPNAASNGTTYRHYIGKKPTFEFGFGLSYTTFAYSGLSIPPTALACDAITVSVTVTNTGTMTSDEVVEVYVATPKSTVPSPRIRLAAFERVRAIPPGKSVVVELTVTPDAHAVVIPAASVYTEQLKVEIGPLEVHVGGSQPADGTLTATVDIKDSSMLRQCDE